jgi:aryl-alcohol dehydrogenase-like predicted oxidoreductase
MGLSHGYGAALPPEQAERVLLLALDLGVDHFDTAALYGFGTNETLVGRVLARHRQRFTLASKCGIDAVIGPEGTKRRLIDGRPQTLRRTCEAALQRLRTDVIDLYYLHRWDKSIPIEESVGALADLVREGKIRAIGLSEVSAATLKQAHAVHPIVAVQSEYSLWTRNPESGVSKTCREIGAALVAFSPVGRGFLAGAITDKASVEQFDAGDMRRGMPRFQMPHLEGNLVWLRAYLALARELQCTPAQLALAWVLQSGPHVVAIPGTTSVAHLVDNMGASTCTLSAATVARLDAMFSAGTVSGARYSAAGQAEVDTEDAP